MTQRDWYLGLSPNDPIAAQQARTEAMLAMEDRWLAEERTAPEQEETDDADSV